MQFSTWVTRWRWIILAAWIAAAVGLLIFAPECDPAANERTSFLPDDSPFRVAAQRLADFFPRQHGLCEAVILFERPVGKLTRQDNQYIERIALWIPQPHKGDLRQEDLRNLTVSSPGRIDLALDMAQSADLVRSVRGMLSELAQGNEPVNGARLKPLPPNPLRTPVTKYGQAAMVRVNIPTDFITYRSTRIVQHLRRILLDYPPPPGLRVAISGSAGYGHDYADFVQESYHLTVGTTLLAVVLILLIVYRAPVAAMIPLFSISLAAAITLVLANIAQTLGYSIGMAEHIFVFVLMYGAGVDYSLLYISRYREMLLAGQDIGQAPGQALRATLPAILASSATDAVGILTLVFCRFVIFQTTGPAVAVALIIALLASITLVPALTALLGPRMFWPRRIVVAPGGDVLGRHRIWSALARWVTRRPGWVLVGMLLLLAIPALRGTRIHWVYDALAGIESEWTDNSNRPCPAGQGVGNAAAGIEIARRHIPIGEIAPIHILIESKQKLSPRRCLTVSSRLTQALDKMGGVQNVRSLTQPLGGAVKLDSSSAPQRMVRMFAWNEYVGNGGRAMRLEAIMGINTMSDRAMTLVQDVRRTVDSALRDEGLDARVDISGATAQMREIRNVTQQDFHRVAVLVLGVIFLIVLLLLRDWLLTLFMVAGIGISYLATLGLCAWIFAAMGDVGMDWKVQIFLFVVMAAVGVDYNIFLAARLAQEARTTDPRQAVARAMVYTGPVISSCGIIMAATLGSLMVGEIDLLKQLGVAFALGMLIDTFLMRPLVLPAFAACFRRTGHTGRLAN